MAHYVDGFLIPIAKKKVEAYKRLAKKASVIWKDYGALEYRECIGDDLSHKGMTFTFPKAAKAKSGQTVVFSWIVYKSRAHRDSVNKKVMKDPRLAKMMASGEPMPFDVKHMAYGGFKVIVEF